MPTLKRRTLLAAALATPLTARAQGALSVAALFAGSVSDGGFMQAGYQGLMQAHDKLGVKIAFKQGIAPQQPLLEAALRDLAAAGPDLIIAHGGQNNAAAKVVAAEFPKLGFVVTQGNVTGANLASYSVLQEQSAFLAGALAAWVTKSGVVGHMSGIRVVPGLQGRAAYAAGVAHANPKVRLLTNFSGNQDDTALAQRVALAMIDAQADIIFTMLNAGRAGAIDACRARHVPQIGNVVDFVAQMPDVFIGSAVADSGIAVLAAVEDASAGRLTANAVKKVGLERPDAVRLTIRNDVPADIRDRLTALSADIRSGKVDVPTEWSGDEFKNPA